MRLGIAAAAVLVTLSIAAPARAGGLYVSEGFGGTRIENDLGRYVDGAVRIRVALGYRADKIALEAWAGADIAAEPIDGPAEPDLVTWGLDIKRAVRLSRFLEVYVRGSMSKMAIDDGDLAGYGGRGLGFGTGIQLKGKAPILTLLYWPAAVICAVLDSCKSLGPRATIALFADQGYDFYRLHGPGRSYDVEATRWTFGLAVGGDF